MTVTINGMPHLANLGQMLEERGGFAVRLCPEGLVGIVTIHSNCIFSFVMLSVVGQFFVNSQIPVSPCDAHFTGRWDVCKGCVEGW